MSLSAAVLGVMLSMPSARAVPGHAESEDTRRERYASIAADIAAVSSGASDAAVLLGVTYHESGWAPDVDAGRCYRGPGWEARCDAGRAVCIAQLQLPREAREEARTDRRACLRRGLAAARQSVARCRSAAPAHRYAGLSGSCARGLAGSRRIHALIERMRAKL